MMKVHRWTATGFATFVVMGFALYSSGSEANASFSGFAFSSSFGSFTQPESIGIDETTGDIYVYDELAGEKALLERFDAAGNPVDFSALATNAIVLNGGRSGEDQELAVDNSSGPTKGDIYAADGTFFTRALPIYGSDGTALGELTEEVTEGEPARPIGVAVDRAGSVYLSAKGVLKYTPHANPVTNGDYLESLVTGLAGKVGVDADGDVYIRESIGGAITRYDPSQFGAGAPVGTHMASKSLTFTVANAFSGELFVVLPEEAGGEVVQYDASGNVLSAFGAHGAGIAFNAKNGKLYVSNGVSKTVEIWQGAVALPSLQTREATNVSNAGSATLNGAVEPEEQPVGTCAFQYGTGMSYGSVGSCKQATPLTGNGIVPVSADLSTVMFNHVYHYRLTAENGNGTSYGADKTFQILVSPTVDDQAPTASSLTRASAKLIGTINPEQADTSYHFDIGVTESYDDAIAVAHTGSGILGDTTIEQQVGELLPNTTYHYRLVADNVAGRVVGADHTFTTGAATPPSVVTGGSNGVGQNAATISGTVNTNGLPTSYGFEIGTSTDYGPRTGLGAVGAGGSEISVSLALTGLFPGTTYHYRMTATNIDGTTYGADQTFTTGVFANTFAEPPSPLPFVAVPQIAFPPEAKQGTVKKKTGKAKHKKVKKHGNGKKKAKSKKKK
jgi:hypothetical protein